MTLRRVHDGTRGLHSTTRPFDVTREEQDSTKRGVWHDTWLCCRALKYPETPCKAMFNLHAMPAFSSSSETETANLLPTQNRTW